MRETHLHIYAFPSDVDLSVFESLLNQHLERNVSRKWQFRTKAPVFPSATRHSIWKIKVILPKLLLAIYFDDI